MKRLVQLIPLCLSLIGASAMCFGQNDSILPNYQANYTLLQISIGGNSDWAYNSVGVYFDDDDEDDTLEVGFNPNVKIYFDGYKAFILGEDNVNSLYIYPDSAVVLYDFGLTIGDTAYFENNSGVNDPFTPVIVDNISYQDIQGELHKKLTLSNQDIWVQGIGSLIHPLWPVMSHFEINYIFCSADLYYVNQGNYYGFLYEEQDCSWYYEIGVTELLKPAKKVIKTIDLLGREVNGSTTNFTINVYDDGTIKKVYRIE